MSLSRRATAPALVLAISVGLSGCYVLDEDESDGTSSDTGGADSSDPNAPRTEEDVDFGIVEVYEVTGSAALSPVPDAAAAAVWDMFVRVASRQTVSDSVIEFRAGDSASSDTLAYVVQQDDPDFWALAANLAYADDADLLLSTLVHEYAHIVSLSPDQVDPYVDECDTLLLLEGCALPDSAIFSFSEEFWSGYADAPDADNSDDDVAWDFYLAHEDEFVSDYAATNVIEDFAESFMVYVLDDPVDGDFPIAQKLRFFADQAEFVRMRDRIRAEFGM
ncbi:hypothetical protein GCM10009808_12830 [Microbacterium sediminicola]|uniref:NADH:ubiquinone oxidoreductase subunit 4 (Chain M) n=1 Tax=Microbacterium sediminicola TaxID=415210 RepID=A0ABN2I130_9MICO